MNICYLLSSAKDFKSLICNDSGPEIAHDYNVEEQYLETISPEKYDFIIVDPWIQKIEYNILTEMISDSKATKFFLTVTDPYIDLFFQEMKSNENSWGRLVDKLYTTGKANIALTYSPTGLSSYWISKNPSGRIIYMPYVYNSKNERPLTHQNRSHKVIISGNRRKENYPLRHKMDKYFSFTPLLRNISERLPHPGYDKGAAPHGIMGDNYIEYLSRYKFATTCSSTYRLEFLKYREFAYAGVVPIGDLPFSLYDCPPEAWIPWRRNVFALWRTITTMRDTEDRAKKFRQFMYRTRDASLMQNMLREQLEKM